MNNEQFFLDFVVNEFVDLLHKDVIIENGMRIYVFRNYWADGTSSVYRIRFNQVGGYIDYEEIER